MTSSKATRRSAIVESIAEHFVDDLGILYAPHDPPRFRRILDRLGREHGRKVTSEACRRISKHWRDLFGFDRRKLRIIDDNELTDGEHELLATAVKAWAKEG
jgi:hypothetical protein